MSIIGFYLRRRGADILAVLFIKVCLFGLSGPLVKAFAQGGMDRNQRCISNVFQIAAALQIYCQDYDQVFPYQKAVNDPARFQQIITPYLYAFSSNRNAEPFSYVYRCPITGNVLYEINKTLANKPLTSFDFIDTVETLRDSKKHPDGKITIGFLDGHVEYGGVDRTDPDTYCILKANHISAGFIAYAHDYDGTFPFQQNDNTLRQVLYPYIKLSNLNCPANGKPYNFNKAVRGHHITDYPDKALAMLVSDSAAHKSGITTATFLDRYLEQKKGSQIVYPAAIRESINRIGRVMRAGAKYAQKTPNHQLPPMDSYASFQTALLPILGTSRPFQPPRGGITFQINTDLNGTSYDDNVGVVAIRDLNPYDDGLITVGYFQWATRRVAP